MREMKLLESLWEFQKATEQVNIHPALAGFGNDIFIGFGFFDKVF